MIALPSSSREAVVQGFPTGLAGTVGFQVIDNVGGVTIARTTVGITERPAGSGVYVITFTTPAAAGDYTIVWDKGSIAPANVATEELVVSFTASVAAAPSGSDLCTLADVRLQMELDGVATELDPLITALIPIASQRIMDEVKRELAPVTSTATHTFRARGRFVDFAPYDLRSATSVVLDPSGGNKTLTTNVDYLLQPAGADKWGVYTDLKISDYIDIETAKLRFGIVHVQVAGAWGFPAVPEIAKQAAITAVRAWIRRDSARGAYTDPEMNATAPDPGAYYALPPASRMMVMPLKRSIG